MFYDKPETKASPAQLACLAQMGIACNRWISSYEADWLIKQNKNKWEKLPATDRQRFTLQQRGCWREGMTRGEACELIGKLKARQERHNQPFPWFTFEGDGRF